MSLNNQGMSYCAHCGAEFHLFSIFNRDMQGLCNVWKRRHERACSQRTPEQRQKWAKPYVGKDRYESSLVVDLSHPGFLTADNRLYKNVNEWYEALVAIAKSHGNQSAVRDFEGWTDTWEVHEPSDTYYSEFPEHKIEG